MHLVKTTPKCIVHLVNFSTQKSCLHTHPSSQRGKHRPWMRNLQFSVAICSASSPQSARNRAGDCDVSFCARVAQLCFMKEEEDGRRHNTQPTHHTCVYGTGSTKRFAAGSRDPLLEGITGCTKTDQRRTHADHAHTHTHTHTHPHTHTRARARLFVQKLGPTVAHKFAFELLQMKCPC